MKQWLLLSQTSTVMVAMAGGDILARCGEMVQNENAGIVAPPTTFLRSTSNLLAKRKTISLKGKERQRQPPNILLMRLFMTLTLKMVSLVSLTSPAMTNPFRIWKPLKTLMTSGWTLTM